MNLIFSKYPRIMTILDGILDYLINVKTDSRLFGESELVGVISLLFGLFTLILDMKNPVYFKKLTLLSCTFFFYGYIKADLEKKSKFGITETIIYIHYTKELIFLLK